MVFLVPWLDLTVPCPPHIIIRGNIFKTETIRHLVTEEPLGDNWGNNPLGLLFRGTMPFP